MKTQKSREATNPILAMKYPYDFGVSQDDPQVEGHGLNLDNSSLLCIASGGDVPLSLLANYNTQITAVDISLNQIRLCRLKLASILELEPHETAILLGFRKDLNKRRKTYLSKVIPHLPLEDTGFWRNQKIGKGLVNLSRFEQYISLFCMLVRNVLGNKKIRHFMELDSIEEQKLYFDNNLHNRIIQWIFQIAFSPRLYKNGGLDKQALIHQKGNSLPSIFYSKFRDFFTETPARQNFYLQFYMLGEIKYNEALPSYLQDDGIQCIKSRAHQLHFQVNSIYDLMGSTEILDYKNYALSNVSDWCEEAIMNKLLLDIFNKVTGSVDIVLRYIHKNPVNDFTESIGFERDSNFEKAMISLDRFPFYSLIKATTK